MRRNDDRLDDWSLPFARHNQRNQARAAKRLQCLAAAGQSLAVLGLISHWKRAPNESSSGRDPSVSTTAI